MDRDKILLVDKYMRRCSVYKSWRRRGFWHWERSKFPVPDTLEWSSLKHCPAIQRACVIIENFERNTKLYVMPCWNMLKRRKWYAPVTQYAGNTRRLNSQETLNAFSQKFCFWTLKLCVPKFQNDTNFR